MPLLNEKREKYEKLHNLYEIWKVVIDDYSLSEKEASTAVILQTDFTDITNQEELSLLRIKDANGNYVPLGLEAVEEPTKENLLNIIHQYMAIVQSGTKIYNFNRFKDEDGLYEVSVKESGSYVHDTIRYKDLEAPARVSKPGLFKTYTNKWFGWFKADIRRYNDYSREKEVYDAKMADKAKQDAVIHESIQHFQEAKEEHRAYHEIRREVLNNKPIEDKLKEKYEREKRRHEVIEVVSGRSNKYLGHHENYHTLSQTPLNMKEGLPIHGLALLAACSSKINKSVVDGSTQIQTTLKGKYVPTKKEQELIDNALAASNRTNVAAKILESVYGGTDILRMGDRTTAIIQSRVELNEAIEKYIANDKQPLADLINDSLTSVYGHAYNLTSKCNTPSAMAVAEITDSLSELFQKDPDFRALINFPDDKFLELKGASKAYKLLDNMEAQVYEAFKADEGPNTPKRKEILDELLFTNTFYSLVESETTKSMAKAGKLTDNELKKPEYTNLVGHYSDAGDIVNLMSGFSVMLGEKNTRLPQLIAEMGKDDFDIQAFKAKMISQIRETETYKQFMSLERELLFSKKFDEVGETILSEAAVASKKKLEQMEKAAGNNEIQEPNKTVVNTEVKDSEISIINNM